jgi:hypothetical protein
MGRASLVIDYQKLQSEIDDVEANGAKENYTLLCQAVHELDSIFDSSSHSGCCKTTKHRPLPIHSQQVYQALAAKKVIAKTQPGKRGRTAGVTVKRTTKAEKFADNPEIMKVLNKLEKDVPEAYRALFERAKNGSIKAFLQLKCYYCYGFSRAAKSCTCSMCPLLAMNMMMWPNRSKSEDFELNPMDKVLK